MYRQTTRGARVVKQTWSATKGCYILLDSLDLLQQLLGGQHFQQATVQLCNSRWRPRWSPYFKISPYCCHYIFMCNTSFLWFSRLWNIFMTTANNIHELQCSVHNKWWQLKQVMRSRGGHSTDLCVAVCVTSDDQTAWTTDHRHSNQTASLPYAASCEPNRTTFQ